MYKKCTCHHWSLSDLNPTFVMPSLCKVLIQILTELEYSGFGHNKKQGAKLLCHLISQAPNLVKPYQEAILKVGVASVAMAICGIYAV